ncbi:MAG: zinc-ribbon domain-containing protein [Candidatus Lokiarchaeota archaeon]|nr:zinc-ribbon domain-containing protein [Candidatus Lokiarchaeota archaeon]
MEQENNKYKNRYYSNKSYEAAAGSFGCASTFLFVAILSLVFNSLSVDFMGLRYWGYWLFIPAFFIFIGGFQQIYTNVTYKRAIKAAITQRGTGTFKLEDIALEVGIKPKDVLRVLLSLRNSGKIRYRFNADTGEIMLGESVSYVPSEEFEPPSKQLIAPIASEGKNFCVYCGHQLAMNANFCENCGSKIN